MSNKTFAVGIAVCLALMIALGFGLNALNRGHSRPEGVAEDWLAAVGDSVRKGVEGDATRRAEEIGPTATEEAIASDVFVARDTKGKSAFADLEVGKAVGANTNDAAARFRVNSRRGDDLIEIEGAIVLKRVGGDWQVLSAFPTKIGDRELGKQGYDVLPKLPSEGGPPPSSASASLWFIALGVGVLVTIAASALVNWAGRGSALAMAR
ncbi:MAG TPA: hypothetical protein VNB24_00180 [Acidimicrobiales bacterium]|nr:hypothetical protein [Acidimicrobiales bacterium]